MMIVLTPVRTFWVYFMRTELVMDCYRDVCHSFGGGVGGPYRVAPYSNTTPFPPPYSGTRTVGLHTVTRPPSPHRIVGHVQWGSIQ